MCSLKYPIYARVEFFNDNSMNEAIGTYCNSLFHFYMPH